MWRRIQVRRDIPRRQVIILVGDAGWSAFRFDPSESRDGLRHGCDILMNIWGAASINHITNCENTRSDHLSIFNSCAFNETINIGRAGAAEYVVSLDYAFPRRRLLVQRGDTIRQEGFHFPGLRREPISKTIPMGVHVHEAGYHEAYGRSVWATGLCRQFSSVSQSDLSL